METNVKELTVDDLVAEIGELSPRIKSLEDRLRRRDNHIIEMHHEITQLSQAKKKAYDLIYGMLARLRDVPADAPFGDSADDRENAYNNLYNALAGAVAVLK